MDLINNHFCVSVRTEAIAVTFLGLPKKFVIFDYGFGYPNRDLGIQILDLGTQILDGVPNLFGYPIQDLGRQIWDLGTQM